MRSYSIFDVKKEHQEFIYGRERLLLEFIQQKDSQKSFHSPAQELSYLCEPLNTQQIEEIICEKLVNSFPRVMTGNHAIRLFHPLKGSIQIEIYPYYISAICEGSRMLDLDLFATLTKHSDCFIAFNKEEMECGWLKPVRFHTHHS